MQKSPGLPFILFADVIFISHFFFMSPGALDGAAHCLVCSGHLWFISQRKITATCPLYISRFIHVCFKNVIFDALDGEAHCIVCSGHKCHWFFSQRENHRDQHEYTSADLYSVFQKCDLKLSYLDF